jgi:uncharacterized protein (UPF0333 family)
MDATKLIAAVFAVLLVGAGAVAAGTAATTANESSASDQAPATVDVRATHDNGTVTVTVTENGTDVENVTVVAGDEQVGTTGADGTVTFETNAPEELELTKGEFEGELKYAIVDGSLVLQEEEYEFPEVESEDADEEDEEADDGGEESEDESEGSEDEHESEDSEDESEDSEESEDESEEETEDDTSDD